MPRRSQTNFSGYEVSWTAKRGRKAEGCKLKTLYRKGGGGRGKNVREAPEGEQFFFDESIRTPAGKSRMEEKGRKNAHWSKQEGSQPQRDEARYAGKCARRRSDGCGGSWKKETVAKERGMPSLAKKKVVSFGTIEIVQQ